MDPLCETTWLLCTVKRVKMVIICEQLFFNLISIKFSALKKHENVTDGQTNRIQSIQSYFLVITIQQVCQEIEIILVMSSICIYYNSQIEHFTMSFICPPTCSYAINLIADSGAIFNTLMPLPRQSDLTPPSFNICRKPSLIVSLFFFSIFDPCTYKWKYK